MINTLIPAAAHAAFIVTALFAVATPAFSQAPTDAQRSAIRSECRSDYEAHCASVPPGGAASLQCLQKNMSSLSSSCQTAVRAVEAPAASTAEPAPAAGPPKPRLPKRRKARRPRNQATRKLPRYAARAAPTIRKSAPACRPVAPRRCNVWKRTSRNSQATASRPSTPPAAAQQRRQQAPPRQPRQPPVLQQRPLPRRLPRWCCGRCGRAKNYSS